MGVSRGTGILRTAIFLLAVTFFLATFLLIAFFFAAGFFFETFLLAAFFFVTSGFFFNTFRLLTFLVRPAFFLVAGFFLTTFRLLAFFPAAFFLAVFLAAFFFATFFLVTFFRVTFFFAAFFLATFFRVTFFLAAGFLRATVLFFAPFFAEDFLRFTVRCLPIAFFLAAALLFAAVFREPFAGLRVLLAVFFAGIFYSYRIEKNAQLYIDLMDMEALKRPFFTASKLAVSGQCQRSNCYSKMALHMSCGDCLGCRCLLKTTIVLSQKLHYTSGIPPGVGQTPPNAT